LDMRHIKQKMGAVKNCCTRNFVGEVRGSYSTKRREKTKDKILVLTPDRKRILGIEQHICNKNKTRHLICV
jgi:hypothetical protein